MTRQETEVLPYGHDAIARAAELILAGQPVAVPTETVYGLAADATNSAAVARIYAAKGRPSSNPLIVHVSDLRAAERLGQFSPTARDLAERYWPGPLTVVVPVVPDGGIAEPVTAGLSTIALRIPAHRAMRDLLQASDRPLAAPSANASGRISPTQPEHVLASLGGRIPLLIDGGATPGGIESTIVRIDGGSVKQLRRGPLLFDLPQAADERIVAPGQLASHYAPTKPLRLNVLTAASSEWLIGFGEVDGDDNLSPNGDLEEAAARLYGALFRADASAASAIALAAIPERGIGKAINDRARRAAWTTATAENDQSGRLSQANKNAPVPGDRGVP